MGYDINGVLTHDIDYGSLGPILSTKNGKSMCVSAQLEIILTAFQIYAAETGDHSVYDYLPKRSYQQLSIKDIKGHIWVNSAFRSNGAADALKNFGMGEILPFERLQPGSFINFNRSSGSGHGVVFLAFVDALGNEYDTYNSNVIGFKYYSSQGMKIPPSGLDFRYAIFEKFGCPEMPYYTDCNVVYSKNQNMLTTGMMWAPSLWQRSSAEKMMSLPESLYPVSVFDSNYMTGE